MTAFRLLITTQVANGYFRVSVVPKEEPRWMMKHFILLVFLVEYLMFFFSVSKILGE